MSDFDFTPENVNGIIRQHIGQWEARIAEQRPDNSKDTIIVMLRMAVIALDQLQHDLHLCHCSDEAYEENEEEQ